MPTGSAGMLRLLRHNDGEVIVTLEFSLASTVSEVMHVVGEMLAVSPEQVQLYYMGCPLASHAVQLKAALKVFRAGSMKDICVKVK